MTSLHHNGAGRNTGVPPSAIAVPPIPAHSHPIEGAMSPGGREIYRRTQWSIPRCNATAAAWAFGQAEV